MSAQTLSEKFLLTPTEFVDALHDAISLTMAYRYLHDGRIKSLKNGKRFLIPRSELTAWPSRELEAQE